MAMVNPIMNMVNVKDSRWLTLEVCREYQRNKCSRPETECKFAHPPPHVEVQNGRVTCCFDSIKGKCQRKDPPCKYLHPPQHLREQLLQNGRNNLILKNLQMQALAAGTIPPMVPGMVSTVQSTQASQEQSVTSNDSLNGYYLQPWPYKWPTTYRSHNHLGGLDAYSHAVSNGHPFITTMQNASMYNPYVSGSPLQGMTTGVVPAVDTGGVTVTAGGAQVPAVVSAGGQQKVRADRLEVCREYQRGTCTRQPSECRFAHPPENVTVDSTDNHVTVCMDYIKGKCARDTCRYFHPPPHLQAQIKAAQHRANATAQAQALPQVVEVLTAPGKKRPRDPADDLVLGMPTMTNMTSMVQYVKRPAVDNKSGIPVYQPGTGTTAYQQAATLAAMQQLQQQAPFVPVTNYVEVSDGKVTVCRDAAKGKCTRPMCKYYHIPLLPPVLV